MDLKAPTDQELRLLTDQAVRQGLQGQMEDTLTDGLVNRSDGILEKQSINKMARSTMWEPLRRSSLDDKWMIAPSHVNAEDASKPTATKISL